MPLSEPSGGSDTLTTIGSGAVVANYPIRNTGADTAITFGNGIYDSINDRLILTGDGDYVGTKANATAKLQQAGGLPSHSPALSQAVLTNGRLMVGGGNSVSLSDDVALSAFTDITPPGAFTRRGVFTFSTGTRIYSVRGTGGASSRIEFSDDLGSNWSNLDTTGFTDAVNRVTISPDGTMVVMSGATQVAWATQTEVDNDNWNVLSLIGFLAINSTVAQWDDDNRQVIIAADNGSVNILDTNGSGSISEVPVSANHFRQTSSNGLGINFGAYVPSVEGWIMGDTSTELITLTPKASPLTMEQGFYMGDSMLTLNTSSNFAGSPAMVDGDGVMLLTGFTNRGAIFVPGAG